MSVKISRPVSFFTSASNLKPSSSPGPLGDSSFDRLALSNDPLKMIGTPQLSDILASSKPIFRFMLLGSSEQGPAIKVKDCKIAGGEVQLGINILQSHLSTSGLLL